MRRPWDWSYPEALLIGLSVTVVVALVVVASTSSAAFGLYNAQWDGSADIRAITQEGGGTYEVTQSTETYSELTPNESIAFVLSPDQEYSQQETARIERFVREGGTLLVAADFEATGNDLLAELGADARMSGVLLRDEQHLYRSPAMPVATNVTNSTLTAGVEELTLNYASPVEPGGARVLVRTAPSAYVDTNRNGELDESETPREWPVVTVEAVGDGQVIVVGDPSVFINAMLEREGNRQFVRALTADSEVVLLDTSHTAGIPPLVTAVVALREQVLLQVLAVGLLLGLVGLVTKRPLAWYRNRFGQPEPTDVRLSETELRAVVERRHPGWDADRVERVVKGVTRQREDGSVDD